LQKIALTPNPNTKRTMMLSATRTARIRSRTILGRLFQNYPTKTAVVPRRTFAATSQSVDDSSKQPPTSSPNGTSSLDCSTESVVGRYNLFGLYLYENITHSNVNFCSFGSSGSFGGRNPRHDYPIQCGRECEC
jgi:hypothetical protein